MCFTTIKLGQTLSLGGHCKRAHPARRVRFEPETMAFDLENRSYYSNQLKTIGVCIGLPRRWTQGVGQAKRARTENVAGRRRVTLSDDAANAPPIHTGSGALYAAKL